MPLFETSRAAARTPGPHVVDSATPRIISGVSMGRIGLAAQTEWGPVKSAYVPDDATDFLNTFFPAGSPRSSTGWLAVAGRKKAPWTMARVLGGNEGLLAPDGLAVTTHGTPGAATYKYKVVAKNAIGHTQGSCEVDIATGNATLDITNYNVLAWTAVTGATHYDVYLVAAAGNVATAGLLSADLTGVTYSHKGEAGDGNAAPTSNTTGWKTAVCYLLDSSSVPVAKLIAKYAGTLAHGFVVTVAAASGGDATKFDLAVSLSNAVTGATGETYKNLKTAATAVLADVSGSVLLSSYALVGTPASRPANGAYSFVGGSNGAAVAAADYDDAFDALDAEDDVSVFGADDCGDSIRPTVNGYILTHAQGKTDRQGFVQSNTGDAWATVKTDVTSYRDKSVKYFTWAYVRDVNGVEQLSPAWTFAATGVVSQKPNQSEAWWADDTTELYSAISSLPSDKVSSADETVRGDATELGICIPIKLPSGRYAMLHDRTTSTTLNERYGVTFRIRRYIAKSSITGLAPWTNGPNGPSDQRDAKTAMDNFLESCVAAGYLVVPPSGTVAYKTDIGSGVNTSASVAAGEFAIALEATTCSVMEKIFLLFQVGPTVVVSAS